MNEKWMCFIIGCTIIYIILDFIKEGLKENAIKNGMNEKEAREYYKWKNLFHKKREDKSLTREETIADNYVSASAIDDNTETKETDTYESRENESLPEVSKHLYW